MAEDRLTSMQADVLRAYRRAKGYSQEYVATLLGVSRQTYVAVEQGQAPVGNDDRRLLARSLGIPPSMLGVSGGAVIPLPATDLVRALWAQFYSGTAPGMLGLVPHAQLWLDEQPRVHGPDSGIVSQLYQAITTSLRDARMYGAALEAANAGIVFAEHLSGPREPNADASSAYYRRSRVYAGMAESARGDRRGELLGLAAADAAEAVARAPENRIALRVVSLQNLAQLQAIAGAGSTAAIATLQQAFQQAGGNTRYVRDATNITLSRSGLYHAAARVYIDLARIEEGRGYLESAEDHIADAIGSLSAVEHRWNVDMQITHMEIAARQGNMRDAADIAPQIASALDIHQSRRLGTRALEVISRVRVPRANRAARENLSDAAAQIKRMLSSTGVMAV